MKVVILAGGKGTRLSEETSVKPKPMVEIGGKPILWHIMKLYSHYGYNEFVVLLGYLGYSIKEYFANYFLHQSDVTFDLKNNRMEVHQSKSEDWRVSLVDTGIDTLTAGRLQRAHHLIGDEPFLLTYGDGVADVDIASLVEYHKSKGSTLTVTAIQPESRYGVLDINDASMKVTSFLEKPKGEAGWINGGFFVCSPRLFDFIPQVPECDDVMLERDPMERIASEGGLVAYQHRGFWQCMDTLRDKTRLNDMWESGNAKWKVWK